MQNILVARVVNATGTLKHVPKIADFGLAQQRTGLTTTIAGTRVFMAPEAREGLCSEKTDVYSFGHVMFRTFCLNSEHHVRVEEKSEADISSVLAKEWMLTNTRVTEKNCCDVAELIGKSFHPQAHERPSFFAVARELRRLRLSIGKAWQCCERL
eukprot:1934142-Amphidinium_carterae.1